MLQTEVGSALFSEGSRQCLVPKEAETYFISFYLALKPLDVARSCLFLENTIFSLQHLLTEEGQLQPEQGQGHRH